jgi:hypothetical protein
MLRWRANERGPNPCFVRVHQWLETCAASAARKTFSNRNIARRAFATTVHHKDRFAEANLIQALSRIKRASHYDAILRILDQ